MSFEISTEPQTDNLNWNSWNCSYSRIWASFRPEQAKGLKFWPISWNSGHYSKAKQQKERKYTTELVRVSVQSCWELQCKSWEFRANPKLWQVNQKTSSLEISTEPVTNNLNWNSWKWIWASFRPEQAKGLKFWPILWNSGNYSIK